MRVAPPIHNVSASAYRIGADAPESDGTFEWDATAAVRAELTAGPQIGIGDSYADAPGVSPVATLHADRNRPGLGLELKRADAAPYRCA